MPRTGRPKVENPLDHNIKVRIDDKMNQALLQYAEEHHQSRTEVIRKAIRYFLEQQKASPHSDN